MKLNVIPIFWISIFLLNFYGCDLKSNKINILESEFEKIPFVFIPKGEFTYGINDEKRNLGYDFWIMKYEVTNKQYSNFIKYCLSDSSFCLNGDTLKWYYQGDSLRLKGYYTAKIFDERIWVQNDSVFLDTHFQRHPVTRLTWFGSKAFCEWKSFTLPNQFEWEKAARGNTGFNYPWGDKLEFNRANFHNSGDPFDNGTTPVGFFNGANYKGYQTIDSPSPYGCYDMAGNAWEYTNSTIFPNLPYLEGGGGGYLYHTGAMIQSWYRSYFGYPIPSIPDRSFISDGCRCIKK